MNLPALILTAALLSGFTGWFWRKPEHGLAVLIALLPFERLGTFALGRGGGHVIRPSQIAAIALIEALLLRLAGNHDRPKPLPRYALPLGGFVASAAVSAALVGNGRIWQNWVSVVLVVGTLWAAAQVLDEHSWRLARRWLFILAGAVCAFGLYQFGGDMVGLPLKLTGLRFEYSAAILGFPRLQSVALEPLYFANYLLIPLFVGGALWLGGQLERWEKLITALAALSLVLTMSRGAFAAAVPGLLVLGWVTIRQRRFNRRQAAVLVGATILGVALAAVLVGAASSRVRGQFSAGPKLFAELFSTKLAATGSFYERLAGQNGAINVIKQAPVFGVGPGRFATTAPQLPSRKGYDAIFVNNTPLAIACEFGLVGLGLLVWFVGGLFWDAIRRLRHQLDWRLLGISLAAAAVLLQSFTFYGVFLSQIWVVLGLILGLLGLEKEKGRRV